MRIYLVQHGEAKSEEEDPRRTLTDKGVGEVQKVAEFLRPLTLAVDTVWHSGKARAQQTAELLAEALGAQARVVAREGSWAKGSRYRNERGARTSRRRRDDCWPLALSRQTGRTARHRSRGTWNRRVSIWRRRLPRAPRRRKLANPLDDYAATASALRRVAAVPYEKGKERH
jgi:broad specificity phosphatase PhoE